MCIMLVHFLKQFVYSKVRHWEILPPVYNITGYVKCCGTVLSIVHIPTCFTSKPGILPSRRLAARLLYLNSASDRNPMENKCRTPFQKCPLRKKSGIILYSSDLIYKK